MSMMNDGFGTADELLSGNVGLTDHKTIPNLAKEGGDKMIGVEANTAMTVGYHFDLPDISGDHIAHRPVRGNADPLPTPYETYESQDGAI